MLVAGVLPTVIAIGTLLPGVTSHGTWKVNCSWLLALRPALTSGAAPPPTVSRSLARTNGNGPKRLPDTIPCSPGVRPVEKTVARLHGDSALRWKSAAFMKTADCSDGPAGFTVRLNVCGVAPAADAVTWMVPAVAPAVTFT